MLSETLPTLSFPPDVLLSLERHRTDVLKRREPRGIPRDIREELFQEAILALIVHIAKGKCVDSVRKFVEGAYQKKCVSHFRKFGKEIPDLPGIEAHRCNGANELTEIVHLATLRKRVLAFWETLLPADQEIFLRLDDDSYEQIGKSLGLPTGTVKARVSRALRRSGLAGELRGAEVAVLLALWVVPGALSPQRLPDARTVAWIHAIVFILGLVSLGAFASRWVQPARMAVRNFTLAKALWPAACATAACIVALVMVAVHLGWRAFGVCTRTVGRSASCVERRPWVPADVLGGASLTFLAMLILTALGVLLFTRQWLDSLRPAIRFCERIRQRSAGSILAWPKGDVVQLRTRPWLHVLRPLGQMVEELRPEPASNWRPTIAGDWACFNLPLERAHVDLLDAPTEKNNRDEGLYRVPPVLAVEEVATA